MVHITLRCGFKGKEKRYEQRDKIIALTGKGGVGKTSISAALVKLLVEEFPEKKILAIDADPAIGLATALGIEPELTLDDIRNEIVANVEDGNTKEAMELLSESRYKIAEAIVEKEGLRFLQSDVRSQPDVIAASIHI